jgi:spore coat polysaccharide biosynthesis protein SpsF
MTIVAIIQARTGSTRLPGKVLLPLLGEPMLKRVVERVGRSLSLNLVVVATTMLPEDDPIAMLADAEGWPLERGSELDLLDRYVQAARAHSADIVVRITSDCPLIDPDVIDSTLRAFEKAQCDYASNALEPRTYPRGLDVEVVTMTSLERAWQEDTNSAWREHVTPYIYRHPEAFRLLRVPSPDDRSGLRWTVDTPEDFELVSRIYDALGTADFGWRQALAVIEAHPEWEDLNRAVRQKVVPPG